VQLEPMPGHVHLAGACMTAISMEVLLGPNHFVN